jgi:NAD(P)-dependent dehydrogenase (short-subunit alcohol dehydrogenase family)
MTLSGKTILVTGGARRIGRHIALFLAKSGANIIVHYSSSESSAKQTVEEIEIKYGVKANSIRLDLSKPEQVNNLITEANQISPIFGLINNASVFEPLSLGETSLFEWQRHLNINLTAPFLLSQEFAKGMLPDQEGRIINILDWRANRPGSDHFPYSISKAALAALTKSLAQSLAPDINVNGIAFGAILPPADGSSTEGILQNVPARRWADMNEVGETVQFLLDGPAYITGEIIHLDGGRHLI